MTLSLLSTAVMKSERSGCLVCLLASSLPLSRSCGERKKTNKATLVATVDADSVGHPIITNEHWCLVVSSFTHKLMFS